MLRTIRSIFSHSWVARILAAVLALSFGAWGIQGALTGGGPSATDAATLRGGAVSADDFDTGYRRALQDAADEMSQQQGSPVDPGALTPQMRQEIGQQVLRRLVTEQALVLQAHKLGLTAPDDLIRQTIWAIPAFKGTDGNFDRARFDEVLAHNRITEAKVIGLVRDELLSRGLIEPIRSAIAVPDILVRTLFGYAAETRTVDLSTVAFASIAPVPPPDPATLQRFYANHPKDFTAPEYRRVRVVVLSPETLGREQTVSEADIKAEYDREAPTLVKPARRSVQIVTVASEARARGITAFWQGGAQWSQVQALAEKDGGTAVALPNASQREFPSASLGTAVFAATDGAVTGPVHDDAGFVVLRVVGAEAGTGDYASVHDQIRDKIAASRASGQIADRVDRLQDAIAGGGLDKIPGNLGAVPAEGTLDAQGDTESGDPAPLPASGALRDAIVSRVFSTAKGTPPALQPGPGGGYFAFEVEGVTPARKKSLEQALPDVIRLWHADAVRHLAELRAASVFADAKAGHALGHAAAAAGLAVSTPAPFRRGGAAPGVPPALVAVAFGLKPGDATMIETPDGFVVAVVTAIGHPDATTQPAAYERLRTQVLQAMSTDVEISYAAHVTEADKPRPNPDVIKRVLSP